jgi:5-methylthioribose kinase
MVIDPEFCCFGHAEVEIGILLGHLLLAHQSRPEILRFLENYRATAPLELTAVLRLAGVEIMRRIIGVGQLPLGYGLPEKKVLLELSQKLVLEPKLDLLNPP